MATWRFIAQLPSIVPPRRGTFLAVTHSWREDLAQHGKHRSTRPLVNPSQLANEMSLVNCTQLVNYDLTLHPAKLALGR